jgi:hypothetical protein
MKKHDAIKFVLPYTSAKTCHTLPVTPPGKTTSHIDLDEFVPGTIADTSFGTDSHAT